MPLEWEPERIEDLWNSPPCCPYGAPQLEVSARLNVNENPYSPSLEMITDITQAVSEAAAGLNRYPDRDFTALREALAGYIKRESGLDFPVEQIWAANGSNEVIKNFKKWQD